MTMESEKEPESFEQFARQRHETDRSVAVWVEGNLGNGPPLGNAEAKRVAELLAGNDRVLRVGPERVVDNEPDEDVGAVLVTLPKDPSEHEWRPIQRRLLSRVPVDVDVVVLADEDGTPWFFKELADVRVVAADIDAPLEYYRAVLDPYTGDVHYTELTPPDI